MLQRQWWYGHSHTHTGTTHGQIDNSHTRRHGAQKGVFVWMSQGLIGCKLVSVNHRPVLSDQPHPIHTVLDNRTWADPLAHNLRRNLLFCAQDLKTHTCTPGVRSTWATLTEPWTSWRTLEHSPQDTRSCRTSRCPPGVCQHGWRGPSRLVRQGH